MPALDNPRHERWCQLVAEAKHTDTEAYQIAYGCDLSSAESNAWRLRADDGLATRIDELAAIPLAKSILSREESLVWLADVVRTPIGKIDERSPLCQSVEHKPDGSVKLKMVPKLESLLANAKLQGWLVERTESTMRLAIYQAGEHKPVVDI